MNQKERMLSGLPYKAWKDGLPEERMENKKKIYEVKFQPMFFLHWLLQPEERRGAR